MASFYFQLYTCRITRDESLSEDFLYHFGLQGNSLIMLVDVVGSSLSVGDIVSWVWVLHGIGVEEVSSEVGKGACFLSALCMDVMWPATSSSCLWQTATWSCEVRETLSSQVALYHGIYHRHREEMRALLYFVISYSYTWSKCCVDITDEGTDS